MLLQAPVVFQLKVSCLNCHDSYNDLGLMVYDDGGEVSGTVLVEIPCKH